MLYIDASRYSNTDKRTGVENYSYHLINELTKLSPDEITLISPRKVALSVKQRVIPFPRLWTVFRLSWEVFRNKKIQTLFIPSHVMPLIHPKNTTITIHDVAFKRYPKAYGRLSRWYLNFAAKFAVKNAQKIITPSIVTKNDLVDLYGCPPEKITVIPLGIEARKSMPTPPALPKPFQDKNYFLYVGRIEHKKNTDTLIKAFEIFAQKHPNYKLVLAGFPGRGGKEILNSIPENLKDRIILPGFISDDLKQVLLEKALAFVFPSRYEGFGLPLLEAMQAGTPIIASDIPSTHEVAGTNALYFKTESPEALAAQMEKMLDEDVQKKLTENYINHLKKFSWHKSAQETLKVLKS